MGAAYKLSNPSVSKQFWFCFTTRDKHTQTFTFPKIVLTLDADSENGQIKTIHLILLFHSQHTQKALISAQQRVLGHWCCSLHRDLSLKISPSSVRARQVNILNLDERGSRKREQCNILSLGTLDNRLSLQWDPSVWPIPSSFSRAVQRFNQSHEVHKQPLTHFMYFLGVCTTLRRILIIQKIHKEMAHCLLGFSILWIR